MASRGYLYHDPEDNKYKFRVVHEGEDIGNFMEKLENAEYCLDLGDPSDAPEDPQKANEAIIRTLILGVLYTTQENAVAHEKAIRIFAAIHGFIHENEIDILDRILNLCNIRVTKRLAEQKEEEENDGSETPE